ncbi:MAG: hypothetical protein V4471_07650 [Pseudomonadota bacterium]
MLKLDANLAEMSNGQEQAPNLQALVIGVDINVAHGEVEEINLIDYGLKIDKKGEFNIEVPFSKPSELLPVPLLCIYKTGSSECIPATISGYLKSYYLEFIKIYKRLNQAGNEKNKEQLGVINDLYQSQIIEITRKFYRDIYSQWPNKLEVIGLLFDRFFIEYHYGKYIFHDTYLQLTSELLPSDLNNNKIQKGDFMGSDYKNEAETFFTRRIINIKAMLIEKLKPMFEKFQVSFSSVSFSHASVDEDSYAKNEELFFVKWLDFFDEKIAFLQNPENIKYLTEFCQINRENIVKNLNYYKPLLVEIRTKLVELDQSFDIDSIEKVEDALESYTNYFLNYFEKFINPCLESLLIKEQYAPQSYDQGVNNMEVQAELLDKKEESLIQSFANDAPALLSPGQTNTKHNTLIEESAVNSFKATACGKTAVKIIKEYEDYLSGYNLGSLSSRSRFLLVTKKGAIGNIREILKRSALNDLNDFKACLAGWESTFVLHRDSYFTQKIGNFFKGHAKTKGALLFEKLKILVSEAEMLALQPRT